MSILDSARAHYESLDRKSVAIPEWGGATLYWTPMTADEHRRIFSKPDDNGKPPDSTLMAVRTLILKGKNEDGSPAFDALDENKLRHGVSAAVLLRVAGAILGEFGEVSTSDPLEQAGND